MALRAKKPNKKPRLRCLIYGPPGVGKTTAAIQFPCPYVIDTEGGTDYYGDIIERSDGAVMQCSSMDEVAAELKALATEKHGYKTVVIDPFTTLFDTSVDEGVVLKGDDFGKHTAYAKRKAKRLIMLLEQCDMNVVLTSHEAPRWEGGKEAGTKPAGWADLGYFADVVFSLRLLGTKRLAKVEKCRPKWFEDQSTFEWSFDAISDAVGPDLFADVERAVLASVDQAERLSYLAGKIPGGQERLATFLARHTADDITDIREADVAKVIAALEHELGG